MRIFTRLIACAATAVLLSAFLFYFADSCFGEKATALDDARRFVFEARRTQALHSRAAMITRSMASKRDIITQVIVGRMCLRDAIDQFQKSNEIIENIDADLIPRYRLPVDSEGVGRQVLMWVRNDGSSWLPEIAQPRLAELEIEFQTLFGRSPLAGPFEDSVPEPADSTRSPTRSADYTPATPAKASLAYTPN